jgi:hypothetical protein
VGLPAAESDGSDDIDQPHDLAEAIVASPLDNDDIADISTTIASAEDHT